MLFVVKNKELFKSNSDVHSIYTTHRTDLILHHHIYLPSTKVYTTLVPKYHLTQNIKDLSHDKKCKDTLKTFLLMGSFYSLEEYFAWDSMIDLGIIYNS